MTTKGDPDLFDPAAVDNTAMEAGQGSEVGADMTVPMEHEASLREHNENTNDDLTQAMDNTAPATDDSITVDTSEQMQPPPVSKKRGPGRPRGSKNKAQPQSLSSKGDSTGRAERSANREKKKAIQTQSVASADNTAANTNRRSQRPSDTANQLARLQESTPDDANHPSVDPPVAQPQASTPGDANDQIAPPPSPPRPRYATAVLLAPDARGISQVLVPPAQTYNAGGSYPGPHLQGSSHQGPSNSGDRPASQATLSYPTGSFAAPGVPVGFSQGPYNTRSHYPGLPPQGFFTAPSTPGGTYVQVPYPAGGNLIGTLDNQRPPPSASNMLPQASPQAGASAPSTEDANSSATPGPTQEQSSKTYFVVPDGVNPIAFAQGLFPNDGKDKPVTAQAAGGQDRACPRPSLAARVRALEQAGPSPQPANDRNDTTDGLGPDNDSAPAQNQQGGLGDARARRIARLACLPLPIVRLQGQTLNIQSLDIIFNDWPRFEVSERMIPFLAEVKETNARIYNAMSFLTDELKLVILSDPVALASQLWPQANAYELRLAIEVTIWSTSWNIFLKKAARNNPIELKRRIDESKRIMKDLVENRGRSPSDELGRRTVGCTGGLHFDDPVASISRILESLSALYNRRQLNIFKQDFCDYMDALVVEQKLLDGGHIPHAGEYSALCVGSAHVPPMLRIAFLDTCEQDRGSRCVLYEILLRQAHRIMRLTSDLYSVAEDMEMGNALNSFILRYETCNNVDKAVGLVVKELQSARQFFDDTAQRKLLAAKATGALEEAKCMIKIDFLRKMCAGHRMWCLANKRHDVFRSIDVENGGGVKMTLPTLNTGI